MEKRYVAIYTKWLFPDAWGGTPEDWERDGILINKEFSSVKECREFFATEIKEKGQHNVYNTQIYDKLEGKYIY